MQLSQISLIFLFLLTLLTACDPTTTIIPEPEPESKLLGSWISEGNNIAELWVDSIVQIELTFLADSTYILTETLIDEQIQSFSGSYQLVDSLGITGVNPITFLQSQPDTVTYKGIYEVEDLQDTDRLTLEIVRTFPDAIYLPPTVLGGFGSTDNVNLGIGNVQQYRKVN